MATRFIDHLLEGDHASRPAFGDVPQGTLYSCTTHSLIYQSDGTSAWSTWATLGGGSPDAADVTFDPTGLDNTAATDVQAALEDYDAAITAASGGGGGWGSPVLTVSGASTTGWSNDISSHWSSNGTEFICNPGTSTAGKFRYTTALFAFPCRIDFEVYFDSTGTSEAGGSWCQMGLGSSANPSKGPVGGLKMTSNNPAANGIGYVEEQSQTGYPLGAATFALDTFIPVSVICASGQTVSVSKSGVVIGGTTWNLNSSGFLMQSLILVAYEAKVRVKNINVYQLG